MELATKQLIADIIAWEKDTSQLTALETFLKHKYNIRRRGEPETQATRQLLDQIVECNMRIKDYPKLENPLNTLFTITKSAICADCPRFNKCTADYTQFKCKK
jgi:hypothetical protein